MYLEFGTRKLSLKKSEVKRLPKRSYVTLAIKLDGVDYTARVTSNVAWCGKSEKALEYIWVEVNGVAMYATLNYGEKAASLAGENFVPKDGVGDRIEKRVTATKAAAKREADRVEKFRVSFAARNGEVAETESPAETADVESETAEA